MQNDITGSSDADSLFGTISVHDVDPVTGRPIMNGFANRPLEHVARAFSLSSTELGDIGQVLLLANRRYALSITLNCVVAMYTHPNGTKEPVRDCWSARIKSVVGQTYLTGNGFQPIQLYYGNADVNWFLLKAAYLMLGFDVACYYTPTATSSTSLTATSSKSATSTTTPSTTRTQTSSAVTTRTLMSLTMTETTKRSSTESLTTTVTTVRVFPTWTLPACCYVK